MLIDLDHNATTAPAPEVIEAMVAALEETPGNPSSTHSAGRAARAAVDRARVHVSFLLGCDLNEVVFTSGGTESDNLAVIGVARARAAAGTARHAVTSAVEHPAIVDSVRELEADGWEIERIAVQRDGRVRADDVIAALRDDTAIVTIMHANNETGAIMPIAEIAAGCRRRAIPLHSDAAQSVGKIPVRVDHLGVDLLTVASHKFYGPKGVGALFVRHGTPLAPRAVGGGQESGLRSGTENVVGIVGFGRACELASRELAGRGPRLRALRDRLERLLTASFPDAVRHGPDEERLPNTLYISLPGADPRALIAELGDRVAMSAGAACHAADGEPASAVLTAMGVDKTIARCAVRLSVGRDNDAEQIDRAAAAITDAVAAARANPSARALE